MTELIRELQPFIIGVLGVLLTYLGRKLNIFLNERIDKDQQELINDIIEGAVKFVEQVTKKDVAIIGEVKFEIAKETVLIILNEKGLTITDVELEVLIEKFVLELKGLD